MSMTSGIEVVRGCGGEQHGDAEEAAGSRAAVQEIVSAGLLDSLFDRVDAGELRLTGEGGFIPEMVKAVLERGLQVELADHLGYEKGDPGGRGSPNWQRQHLQDGVVRGGRVGFGRAA